MVRRTGDSSKLTVAALQTSAWKNGGQRALEVHSARNRFDFPGRKLARQHPAELFAKILAQSGERAMSRLRPVQIEKAELAGFASKTLHGAIENSRAARLESQELALDAACFVPDVDPYFAGADFQNMGARRERQGFIAIFENRGIPAGA